MSVSDFVATTLPLLEMEKNAEVAQVMQCTVSLAAGGSLLSPCQSWLHPLYVRNRVGMHTSHVRWSTPDMFTLGHNEPP